MLKGIVVCFFRWNGFHAQLVLTECSISSKLRPEGYYYFDLWCFNCESMNSSLLLVFTASIFGLIEWEDEGNIVSLTRMLCINLALCEPVVLFPVLLWSLDSLPRFFVFDFVNSYNFFILDFDKNPDCCRNVLDGSFVWKEN